MTTGLGGRRSSATVSRARGTLINEVERTVLIGSDSLWQTTRSASAEKVFDPIRRLSPLMRHCVVVLRLPVTTCNGIAERADN